MRYVEARIEEKRREETYRIYVTDSLHLAPQQKYLQKSYVEVLRYNPADEKSGDEIAFDIIIKAGLTFGEKT